MFRFLAKRAVRQRRLARAAAAEASVATQNGQLQQPGKATATAAEAVGPEPGEAARVASAGSRAGQAVGDGRHNPLPPRQEQPTVAAGDDAFDDLSFFTRSAAAGGSSDRMSVMFWRGVTWRGGWRRVRWGRGGVKMDDRGWITSRCLL